MTTSAIGSATDLRELLQSAITLEKSGRYDQAHQVLRQCDELLAVDGADLLLRHQVRQALWRLSPLWWAKVQHGGTSLRRCRAQDAGFFRRCYADPQFSRQFNRQQPWHGKLEQALQKSGQLPPIQTGLLMWVLELAGRGPIGLASLSTIDAQNRRTELSIGLPGDIAPTLGIKATLMMLHFGLVMMQFNKIYAHVYEDNPQALRNALRLGFVHEGRLQDHFFIAGHGYVSVNQVGLTRAQMQGNAGLKALAQRKIGQVR